MRSPTLLASLAITLAACAGGDGTGAPDGGGGDGGNCASSVTAAPGLVVTDRGPVQGTTATAPGPTSPSRTPRRRSARCAGSAPDAARLLVGAAGGDDVRLGSACSSTPTDPTQVIGSEDCLTLNVWAPASATRGERAAGALLHPRRRQRAGLGAPRSATTSCSTTAPLLAAADQQRRRHLQLSPGADGLAGAPVVRRRAELDRQLRHARPARRARLRAAQHRRVRRRSGARAALRRVGGRRRRVRAVDLAARRRGSSPARSWRAAAAPRRRARRRSRSPTRFATKVGCSAGDVAGCLRALDPSTVELAFPETADVAGRRAGRFRAQRRRRRAHRHAR